MTKKHDNAENGSEITINYSASIDISPTHLENVVKKSPSQQEIDKLITLFESNQDNGGLILAKELSAQYPQSSKVLTLLARFLLKMRNPQEALPVMIKALTLDPKNHEIYAHLALIHFNLNNIAEAEKNCIAALELNINYAKAYANLALIKKVKGEINISVSCFEKAIELDPSAAATRINFGNLLREVGLVREAEKQFTQALTNASEDMRYVIYNNLGTISSDFANNHQAQKYYRKALDIKPYAAEIFSNMLLDMSLDMTLSSEEIFNAHKEYSQRFEVEGIKNRFTFSNDKNTNKKLKIAFVSADLRIHPVSYFLESLLNSLNRELVDITLYSTNNREDELTQRFQKMQLTWINLAGLSHLEMAKKINEDNIDILIDLSGHTSQNSLTIFAYKPSPIQASWIGYFNTTGLKGMDYIFCDEFVIPKNKTCFYTETPYRFKDGYLCFTPPKEEITISSPPVINNKHITFGCFNQLKKMGDEVVELWANILHKVPNSKLFLKSAALDNNNKAQHETLDKFIKFGISPDRLILEGRCSRSDYFKTYNKIDIALDPFPYTGGTTTVEGLWMGVPIVTLQGSHYVSRMGVSILNTVGLTDWIATDKADYINLAVKKAEDISSLTTLRKNLRTQMLTSPLCDSSRFARKFESALQEIWLTYCKTN